MLRTRFSWLLLILLGVWFAERASAEDRQVWSVLGETIELTEPLLIGISGQSNGVVVMDGGVLRCPAAVIGRERTAANNYVWVGGADSRWEVADTLTIGLDGSTNRVVLRNGGRLMVGDVVLGSSGMSAGNALLVGDAGTRAVVDRDLIFGDHGNRVEVGGGADFVSKGHTRIRGTVIGSAQAGHGNLMSVHGFGTTWASHGVVELIGSSALQVSDGASVVCPSLFLRDSRTSLLVRGAGTRLHVAGSMESRGGALLIIDGAELISGDGAIGFSGNTGDPPPARSVLSGDGTMWQCRSNLWFGQELVVRDAARLVVTNTQGTAAIRLVGRLELAGGTILADALELRNHSILWGGGTIVGSVTNGAMLSPGGSPGPLHIEGTFDQGPEGQIKAVLALAEAGLQPPLTVTGKAILAGELLLDVTLAPAFRPAWTNEFAVIRWGSHQGAFSNLPAGSRIQPPQRLGTFGVHYGPEALLLTDYLEDLDGDGIDDVWAMTYFGKSPLGAADLADDPDGDGHTNLAEAIAGTDPFDPESAFRITEVRLSAGTLALRFTQVPGKRYRIWRASTGSGWTEVDSPHFLLAAPGIAEWIELDGPSAGMQLYRVSVE
jgi:T5SS/PEP-CTERM-associated repeat protein